MGFEVQETVAKLVFEDPSFDGLEVRVALIPLEELSVAVSLADVNPRKVTAADLDKVTRLRDAFAGALRGWNLTRSGQPVPATLEGVRSLDLPFVLQLVGHWIENSVELRAQEEAERADIEETLASLPVEAL